MDKVLKQRLVGAAILIALAVIFLPMLFDEGSDRDPVRDAAIELPPPPSDRREVRRLPLDPERARELPSAPAIEPLVSDRSDREISLLGPEISAADEPIEARPDDPVRRAEPEPEPAAAVAQERPPEAVEPEPPDAARADSAAPGTAWLVQVASFSSADTADRVMEQLGRLGHEPGVDVIVRGDSRLHRLRTGPYLTRAEADRARTQIAATVAGVEPVVITAPAGMSAPVAAGTGFSVQVGSFTARSNADRLLQQLGSQGFEAFIYPDESGSRAIWRVRVGTLPSREEASRLQRELLDRAALEGLIVSHP